MRCRTAQGWIVATRDGELGARRQRALDRHLGRCGACRAEQVSIEGVLGLLDGLPTEAEVPARLEQRVLRQVRILADEDGDRARWTSMSDGLRAVAPALAVGAVVVLTVVGVRTDESSVAPSGSSAERRAAAPARPVETAKRQKARVPDEPPAELASRPDLFVDLPMLSDLEKIEHFDSIATMDGSDPTAPAEAPEPSNG